VLRPSRSNRRWPCAKLGLDVAANGKLLFLITEDWFARSHFLPLLRRAQAEGFEVVAASRRSGADLGEVRHLDFPFARGSLRPWDVAREIVCLRRVLAEERPRIIHAVALRPITLALACAPPRQAVAFALTGRGFLAVHQRGWSRGLAWLIRKRLSQEISRHRNKVLLVENMSDAAWVCGENAASAQVVLMPGAGVDPTHFGCAPEPRGAVVVGVLARLLYSKGIDLAVEAVGRLRRGGLDIRLVIAGDPDPDHPRQYADAMLESWRAMEGVSLAGRVHDVNAFWAGVHIACVPSRGGEGLPRALLEAAACGRPIVTTDVPGCADFVVDGEAGRVVSREDVPALASGLLELARDGELRRRMGAAARARVEAGYTEAHAAAQAAEAWRRALGVG